MRGRPEHRFIYFAKPVGMDGPIKIGCSENPDRRLDALMVWSPFPLEIIGTVKATVADEHFLHDCFCRSHSHKEWFLSSPKLRATIKAILDAGTVDVARKKLVPQGTMRKRARYLEDAA